MENVNTMISFSLFRLGGVTCLGLNVFATVAELQSVCEYLLDITFLQILKLPTKRQML